MHVTRFTFAAATALLLTACSGADAPKTLTPAPVDDMTFEVVSLTDKFVSEGVAVADVDRDGKLDVMAGSVWFEAPRWKEHPIGKRTTYPVEGYSDSFLNFAHDIDGDGWVDQIRIALPGEAAYWYKNPGRKGGKWEGALIHPAVGNEAPMWADFDGDDAPELLFADAAAERLVFGRPEKTANGVGWRFTPLNVGETTVDEPKSSYFKGTFRYAHGLGFDDIDGDGRRDILVEGGWYHSPSATNGVWRFHAAPFSLHQDGCGQLYAHDFDGDGDADVLCTTSHNYGTWWAEQTARAGTPEAPILSWRRRLITEDVSQQHSLARADLDQDGDPEFVTGKRWLAHAEGDPGGLEPVFLRIYAYEGNASSGEVSWRWRDIEGGQGSGLHLEVVDLNGDGILDIVTSNKRGVHVYLQRPAN